MTEPNGQTEADEQDEKARYEEEIRREALENPAKTIGEGCLLLLACLGVLILIPGLIFGPWTAITIGGSKHGPMVANPSGTWGYAYTKKCEELGPVSRGGLGYYWLCNADVNWRSGPDKGKTTTEKFGLDELTPDDIGKPVEVVKQRDKRGAVTYARNTERPYEWIAVLGGFSPFILLAALSVFGTIRYRRRQARKKREAAAAGGDLPTGESS